MGPATCVLNNFDTTAKRLWCMLRSENNSDSVTSLGQSSFKYVMLWSPEISDEGNERCEKLSFQGSLNPWEWIMQNRDLQKRSQGPADQERFPHSPVSSSLPHDHHDHADIKYHISNVLLCLAWHLKVPPFDGNRNAFSYCSRGLKTKNKELYKVVFPACLFVLQVAIVSCVLTRSACRKITPRFLFWVKMLVD